MPVSAPLRKLALALHVTTAVGWIGAVTVFLALSVVALTDQDVQTVRGAYLVMEPAARLVLVPLAFASLISGIVLSLGTSWGLFRHYWVIFKLLINVIALLLLLLYLNTFRAMADTAADPAATLEAVRSAFPAVHALLASVILIVAATLAIYKPRGMTRYGRG